MHALGETLLLINKSKCGIIAVLCCLDALQFVWDELGEGLRWGTEVVSGSHPILQHPGQRVHL
jgi:hypothetical protein